MLNNDLQSLNQNNNVFNENESNNTEDNNDNQDNNVNPTDQSQKSAWRRYFPKLLVIGLSLWIIINTLTASQNDFFSNQQSIFKKFNIYALIENLISLGQQVTLNGEIEDRINVLVLGMPGKGKEGPYLTDTIILVSIKPSKGQTRIVSIPRDLVVPVSGQGLPKINKLNAIGEVNESGSGGTYTSQTISKALDTPIHYYIRIDFSGFKDFINDIGGIEIEVEKSFTDYTFPDENYKTRIVSFNQGKQTLDGERALQFVRSRHAAGSEGSDFARSKRQQKVLKAIQHKVLSWGFLWNVKTISNILDDFNEHVQTNLRGSEILRLANILKSSTNDPIYITLQPGKNMPVVEDVGLGGAYIIKAQNNDYKQIKLFLDEIFNNYVK